MNQHMPIKRSFTQSNYANTDHYYNLNRLDQATKRVNEKAKEIGCLYWKFF